MKLLTYFVQVIIKLINIGPTASSQQKEKSHRIVYHVTWPPIFPFIKIRSVKFWRLVLIKSHKTQRNLEIYTPYI